VVASDFGNNRGLFLGPVIADWRARLSSLTCETFIEGRSVGRGGATSIPGSPLEAVRFLLEHCARRGRPLRRGQLVSTGAATGIHQIAVGQTARVAFGSDGTIECKAVGAAP
jgi:2-keto-4-pentenoate hydratase